MSSDTTQPSIWKPLITDWIDRERKLRPHLPVKEESVRVRDAIEIDDKAFILLSFDTEHPWPSEENIGSSEDGADGDFQTAVLQAERVQRPWYERDATRAVSSWSDDEGLVKVNAHLLGSSCAYSGVVKGDATKIVLHFSDTEPVSATVVNGWFLCVAGSDHHLKSVSLDGAAEIPVMRADVGALLASSPVDRSYSDAMYFSPLDLRNVLSLVQWVRSGDVVAVATCIEQYDDGGMLRLRLDSVRTDDDTFVSWPQVSLEIDDKQLASSICGESSLADTISLDIGFRPWLPTSVRELSIKIEGVRGVSGEIEPMVLTVRLPNDH